MPIIFPRLQNLEESDVLSINFVKQLLDTVLCRAVHHSNGVSCPTIAKFQNGDKDDKISIVKRQFTVQFLLHAKLLFT